MPAGLDATIVLLRHGESRWVAEGRFQGQGDSPLTPTGELQAARAGRRLARPHEDPRLPIPAGPPVSIRHSPLARCAATATAVAAAMAAPDGFGVEIQVLSDPGLLEIGQGEWEGRFSTDIEARWGDVLAGWRRDPLTAWAPGGESLPEVDGRVRASLAVILADLRGRTEGSFHHGSQVLGYGSASSDEPWTLLVGHDGTFKVALLALLGIPLGAFWTFPFALCGISVVEVRAGRARLRAHNLTEHLSGLSGPAGGTPSRPTDDRDRSGAL